MVITGIQFNKTHAQVSVLLGLDLGWAEGPPCALDTCLCCGGHRPSPLDVSLRCALVPK